MTDYDVGVDDIPPVTHENVLKVFGENIDRLRDLLFAAIPDVPAERTCPARPPSRARDTNDGSAHARHRRAAVTTDEDPGQLADRMREAVATIVGKPSLEEFRVKTLPLERPDERGGLRPVE